MFLQIARRILNINKKNIKERREWYALELKMIEDQAIKDEEELNKEWHRRVEIEEMNLREWEKKFDAEQDKKKEELIAIEKKEDEKEKERIRKWEEENIELSEPHNDNEDNENEQASKRS